MIGAAGRRHYAGTVASDLAEATNAVKTPSWLTLYVGMAVVTALFQIWVRSSQCAGLFDCGLSYAKGIVWVAIWPMSWIVYLVGLVWPAAGEATSPAHTIAPSVFALLFASWCARQGSNLQPPDSKND